MQLLIMLSVLATQPQIVGKCDGEWARISFKEARISLRCFAKDPVQQIWISSTSSTACIYGVRGRIKVVDGDGSVKDTTGEILSPEPVRPTVLPPKDGTLALTFPLAGPPEKVEVTLEPLEVRTIPSRNMGCPHDALPQLSEGERKRLFRCERQFREGFGHLEAALWENAGGYAKKLLREECYQWAKSNDDDSLDEALRTIAKIFNHEIGWR